MQGAKKLVLQDTECMVEYDIDLDALLRILGNKAFRNRTKRTVALSRKIVVKVRPTLAAKGE